MSNIYQAYYTNDDLKSKPWPFKWPKFCLDPIVWEMTHSLLSQNPLNKWNEIKFRKENSTNIPDCQGIYMFVLKPKVQISTQHSFILYIGEAGNLRSRFRGYFNYKNSKTPSDQKKRNMVVAWEDLLYFNFITTELNKTDRKRLEYQLIDAVIPPINDDFQADIVWQGIKIYRS